MRTLWRRCLIERYGHVEDKPIKIKGRRSKLRRNLGVKAKRKWMKYWRESIPKGYEIHHCDKNIYNNQIYNLALVTKKFHDILHKHVGKKGE